ncbi:MAG: hypothetical protein WC506_06100 [Candidatus Micrarchaeia archaeon]
MEKKALLALLAVLAGLVIVVAGVWALYFRPVYTASITLPHSGENVTLYSSFGLGGDCTSYYSRESAKIEYTRCDTKGGPYYYLKYDDSSLSYDAYGHSYSGPIFTSTSYKCKEETCAAPTLETFTSMALSSVDDWQSFEAVVCYSNGTYNHYVSHNALVSSDSGPGCPPISSFSA